MAERALELSPASLEEGEEGEEEEEQPRRLALPPPTVLSIPPPAAAAAAAPPPSLLVPSPRGSGVLPPLQLSPVIPPLCYGAADPLTSPGAGALPPSLIDSSWSFPSLRILRTKGAPGLRRLFQAVGRPGGIYLLAWFTVRQPRGPSRLRLLASTGAARVPAWGGWGARSAGYPAMCHRGLGKCAVLGVPTTILDS